MALNKIEYEAVSAEMKKIDEYTEEAKDKLTKINALIEESIGANGEAWAGDSASAFKQSWDKIAENFNSFVSDFRQQSINIQTLIRENKAVDTTEAGTVNQ